MTATSRSCAAGSIARDALRARPRTRGRRGSAPAPVAARGVRNHVAPSKRSALALPGPRASAPRIGWPPTKRGSFPTAARTRALRRADVGHRARRRGCIEDVAYDAGQPGLGDRDQGEIGVAKHVPSDSARLDRVALGGRRQDLGILVPADDRVGLAGPARREAPRLR